jgi:hypothetical protein
VDHRVKFIQALTGAEQTAVLDECLTVADRIDERIEQGGWSKREQHRALLAFAAAMSSAKAGLSAVVYTTILADESVTVALKLLHQNNPQARELTTT